MFLHFVFSMMLFTFVWSQPNAHKNTVFWILHIPQFYTILGGVSPPPQKKKSVFSCYSL